MRDLRQGMLRTLWPGECLCGLPEMMKFIIIVASGILISIVGMELMVGCGQVTYFQDRTWESNECLFIANEIHHGRW
jgi:hypothetical protein